MTFGDAARRVGASVTTAELAEAFGVSVYSIQQARLVPGAAGYRSPPEGWEPVLARLARERAGRLLDLADELDPTGASATEPSDSEVSWRDRLPPSMNKAARASVERVVATLQGTATAVDAIPVPVEPSARRIIAEQARATSRALGALARRVEPGDSK